MKIARLVGLAFAAVLAVSALFAAAASAAPEFKPSTKNAFKTTSGTSVLEGSGNTFTCSSDSSAGEITGAKTVGGVVVDFTGCKSTGSGGSNCTAKSKNTTVEGLIVTTTLKGELGTTKEATSGVGLTLTPETTKIFTELAANTCTKETKVTGSIAGEATPVGSLTTTGKLVFTVSSGKQAIKHITGTITEPELVAYTATATESTSDSVTYTKAVEVT